MFVKIFLLGRPGCGKSTTARHIEKYLYNKGWTIQRFKDYDILKEMVNEDEYRESFKQTFYKGFEGFDVLDPAVLDEALYRLDKRLTMHISGTTKDELILIEFARDNYTEAIQYFSPDILENAYYLLIDTDLDTCIRRIEQRMIKPAHSDDHYTSKEVLQKYYVNQQFPLQNDILEKSRLIKNQGSLRNFMKKVDNFVDDIF